jgi:regulatory protein
VTPVVRISALERRPGKKGVRLCLDEDTEMVISLEVCLQRGLRIGDDLTRTDLDEIRELEERRHCLESALRLLSYRQRSEAELRDRLIRKRVPPEIVGDTIDRLRSAGLLDDLGFARNWVENRNQRSPRSRRLAAAELRAFGVTRPVVDDVTATIDERDAAYRAAERRALSLAAVPYDEFRRRISGFLVRRGFDYEIVKETVQQLWRRVATKRDFHE